LIYYDIHVGRYIAIKWYKQAHIYITPTEYMYDDSDDLYS
jgi:hypothetical protein